MSLTESIIVVFVGILVVVADLAANIAKTLGPLGVAHFLAMAAEAGPLVRITCMIGSYNS